MRVLFITDNFLPHIGGSRIYFYNICRHLPKSELSVLTKYIGKAKDFDQKQSFKIYRIPLFRLSKKIFWIFYELPIYLSLWLAGLFIVLKKRIEIILVGEALPSGLIAFLLNRILDIPYIIFTFAEDITTTSRLHNERRIQWHILKRANSVIATCSFVESFLKEIVKVEPQRIVKILPGVDEEMINFKIDESRLSYLKKMLQLNNKKVIFSCARLIERKGIDNVIKALPKVIESIPQVIYLIGGEGEYRKTLEALVEKEGLKDYVKFLGELNHYEDLPYFYSLCDVFIMPSRQLQNYDIEGFGIVFLEANVFGKPVIGGRVGGSSDAIVDGLTGLRVDGENIDEIAQAVIRILSDQEYAKKMGEAGKQRVMGEFIWQNRAKDIYLLLKRISKYQNYSE